MPIKLTPGFSVAEGSPQGGIEGFNVAVEQLSNAGADPDIAQDGAARVAIGFPNRELDPVEVEKEYLKDNATRLRQNLVGQERVDVIERRIAEIEANFAVREGAFTAEEANIMQNRLLDPEVAIDGKTLTNDPYLNPNSVIAAGIADVVLHNTFENELEASRGTNAQFLFDTIVNDAQDDAVSYDKLREAVFKVEKMRKARSNAAGLADLLKDGIPLRSSMAMGRDLIPKQLKNFLLERYKEFWSAEPDRQDEIIAEILEMASTTDINNVEFALNALRSFDVGTGKIAELNDVLDIFSIVGPLVGGAVLATRLTSRAGLSATKAATATAIKRANLVSRLGGSRKLNISMLKWAQGDTMTAAFIAEQTAAGPITASFGFLFGKGWSILDPKAMLKGVTADTLASLGPKTRAALNHIARNSKNTILARLARVAATGRRALEPGEVRAIMKAGREQIKVATNHINGRVTGVKLATPLDAAGTQTFKMEYSIGDAVGGFKTRDQAMRAARDDYGFVGKEGDNFILTNDSNGDWLISTFLDIDETADSILTAMAKDLKTKPNLRTPGSIWANLIRSKRLQVSTSLSGQRDLAVTTKAKIDQILGELVNGLKIRGAAKKRFMSFLDEWHNEKLPIQGLEDFKAAYLKSNPDIGKISDAEYAAFAVQKIGHDLGFYRLNGLQRTRLGSAGYKSVSFTVQPAGKQARTVEPFFGKDVTKEGIPWNAPEPFHAVTINSSGKVEVLSAGADFTADATKKKVQDIVDQGGRIMRLHDNGDDFITLSGFKAQLKGKRPKFVVVSNPTMTPLPTRVIGYTHGGHRVMKWPFYVKAPKFSVHQRKDGNTDGYFTGDVTLLNFETIAEAQKYAAKFNVARKLYARAADAKVTNFSSRAYNNWVRGPNGLSDEFTFKRMKDLEDSGVNMNAEFRVRKSGEGWSPTELEQGVKGTSFTRIHGGKEVSELDDIAPQGDLSKALKQDERINTIVQGRIGNQAVPIHMSTPAPVVNPWKTMRDQINTLNREATLGPLRQRSATEFITEFGHLIADVDMTQMRKNPFYYLKNVGRKGSSVAYKVGANGTQLAQARQYQRAANELFSPQTAIDKMVEDFWQSHFIEGELGNRYPRATSALSEYVRPDKTARALKTATFHLGLGMYNPRQYIQQAAQIGNAAGIAGPLRALKALGAGHMLKRALRNPDMMDELASYKMHGLTPDQFKASARGFDDSGFHIVGNSTVYSDELSTPGSWWAAQASKQNGPLKFFNMGEQFNRRTAWSIAFDEWIEKPGKWTKGKKAMTNKDIAEVLERANLLSGDMLASSKASIQRGLAGVPTQYWAFNMRLMDQYWAGNKHGRGLTMTAKARLLATNAFIYGYPVGLGSATGLINVQDLIQGDASFPLIGRLGQGRVASGAAVRDIDENTAEFSGQEFLEFGALGGALRVFTGIDGLSSIGPDGIDFGNMVFDMLAEGNVDFFDVIFGASIRTGETMAQLVELPTAAFMQLLDGQGGQEWDDLVEAIQGMSTTTRNAHAAYMIATYGEFKEKAGGRTIATGLGLWDAAAKVFGINNFQVDDYYALRWNSRSAARDKKAILAEFKTLALRWNKQDTPEGQARIERHVGILAASFKDKVRAREMYQAFYSNRLTRDGRKELVKRAKNHSPEWRQQFLRMRNIVQ